MPPDAPHLPRRRGHGGVGGAGALGRLDFARGACYTDFNNDEGWKDADFFLLIL